jgi:hypothetical protein
MRTSYWLVGSQLELTGRLARALDQVILKPNLWLWRDNAASFAQTHGQKNFKDTNP